MSGEDSRKLFVAGLPETMTEDALCQLFAATGGTVLNVSLPKDRATGRPRGFGFVTMASQTEANAARDSLNGSTQAGVSISVRPFQAERPKQEGGICSLYVGNLPYDVNQEEIEALVSRVGAGPVVRIHLPTDADGRKRGFGFVTLSSADSANAALEALKGVDLRGRSLHVSIAHPKGERPAGGGGHVGSASGSGGAPGFPARRPPSGGYRGGGAVGGPPAAGGAEGPRTGEWDKEGGAGRNFGEAEGRRRRLEKERDRKRDDEDG